MSFGYSALIVKKNNRYYYGRIQRVEPHYDGPQCKKRGVSFFKFLCDENKKRAKRHGKFEIRNIPKEELFDKYDHRFTSDGTWLLDYDTKQGYEFNWENGKRQLKKVTVNSMLLELKYQRIKDYMFTDQSRSQIYVYDLRKRKTITLPANEGLELIRRNRENFLRKYPNFNVTNA